MHHGSPSTDVAQAVNSFGSRVYLLRPVVICQAQAAEGIHETMWLHLAVCAVGSTVRANLQPVVKTCVISMRSFQCSDLQALLNMQEGKPFVRAACSLVHHVHVVANADSPRLKSPWLKLWFRAGKHVLRVGEKEGVLPDSM